METKYTAALKKKIVTLICINKESTLKTANEFNIPLKTVENWVTAFNKNPFCFDNEIKDTVKYTHNESIDEKNNYDDLTKDELIKELMKKDIEITRLKKNYTVRNRGILREYISFSTKNTK